MPIQTVGIHTRRYAHLRVVSASRRCSRRVVGCGDTCPNLRPLGYERSVAPFNLVRSLEAEGRVPWPCPSENPQPLGHLHDLGSGCAQVAAHCRRGRSAGRPGPDVGAVGSLLCRGGDVAEHTAEHEAVERPQ
jgi:hypothetical protein